MYRPWGWKPLRRYILASHAILTPASHLIEEGIWARELPSCPMGMRMPIIAKHPMDTLPSRFAEAADRGVNLLQGVAWLCYSVLRTSQLCSRDSAYLALCQYCFRGMSA